MQNKIFYSNFQLGFNEESDLFQGELFTVFVTLKFKKKTTCVAFTKYTSYMF